MTDLRARSVDDVLDLIGEARPVLLGEPTLEDGREALTPALEPIEARSAGEERPEPHPSGLSTGSPWASPPAAVTAGRRG